MVKKLLKHEFIYYLRTLVFILPIVLFSGISFRFTLLFDDLDFIWYVPMLSGAILLFIFSSFAALLATSILGVVRFYKNMYSAEGYLTFTLPVNNHQHLWAKVIAFVVCEVGSFLTILISALIATAGYEPVYDALEQLAFEISFAIPSGHFALLIVELILLYAVAIFTAPLQYYSCISIGQLAKKNRILLAIGVYYGYSLVGQFLSTIFSSTFSFSLAFGNLDKLLETIQANPFGYMHLFLWIIIVFEIGLAVLFYFVNIRIMNRKLNLE